MLELSEKEGEFTLSFKGRTILEHSRLRPALEIGAGTGRYKFNYGLFKIKDEPRKKMTGCGDWTTSRKGTDSVTLTSREGITLTAEVREDRLHLFFAGAEEINRLRLNLAASAREHIYGCGEQYTKLDLRGSLVPIWVQEPGLGRGRDLITLIAEVKQGYGGNAFTTYFSQPTFVSSDNWYFHSQGSAYAQFDFRDMDRHSLLFWEVPGELVIGSGADAPETISSLSSFLGRQRRLPEWAYDGMWIGMQGGREITSAKLKDALDAGVKTAAIWCQDWEGIRITSFGKQLFWDWKPDEKLYPDFRGYTEELLERGIRYLGYINPFLALEGPLYAEAKEKNYCVKNSKGEDYYVYITTFPAAMVDLTNPEAVAWIKSVIKEKMIGNGLAGWMADFGEYVPADAVLHSGADPEIYHNRYAADWARINYEAVEEAGMEKEITYFMRAAYTGSSKYSAMNWNGDQLVNWSRDQGFATVIPGTISMGFSGIGYTHSDLGGYTTILWLKRSKELFMRWAELSAFTQTMRTHEGNRPAKNWQFNSDGETLEHLARMTNVYTTLKPYHTALSEEYQTKGLPPVRHPYIHYEEDPVLHKVKYQYMYGPDLLVAPVIKKGKKKWRVYLPSDRWVHLWSGKEFGGGWVTVESPIGEPPVFYRSGTDWKELFVEAGKC